MAPPKRKQTAAATASTTARATTRSSKGKSIKNDGPAKKTKRKIKKKSTFLKKNRNNMILYLEKEKEDSMGTIFTTVVDKLKAAAFLKYKESRKKYVEQLCAEVTKDSLIVVIEALVDNYLSLIRQYSKGKRFSQFEQAWLESIEIFFAPENKCYSLWKAVKERCKCDFDGIVTEERIMISTVFYIVYDIMTGKVKEYKAGLVHDNSDLIADEESTVAMVESNVSLYRYGGFALHSLLQKYDGQPCAKMIPILREMVIKHEQLPSVPIGI